MTIAAGTLLGRYEVRSQIGAGGMGEVYLAEDTKLDRKVALKILPPELADDRDRMSRFVREAKSASALNHPNIITIYEIGESDGTHFIATEFIDGKTLNDYARSNPFDYKSILDIAVQVASALQTAHVAGIVHRDIKPDNVMVRADGLAKILDFGIAKLSAPTTTDGEAATAIQAQTQAGMIIGTPNYMSPEQARGRDVDRQTDIFSFGVVFYEMLSGASPFKGDTVSDVIAAVLTKEPPRLTNVPPELAEILDKTLQKDKRNRYQTAKGLLDDLKEAKEELAIQSRLNRVSSPNVEEPQTQILKAVTTGEENRQITLENLKSIAVLPFTNMSADGDNEYFCDGLAEELLNALSKIDDLKVAARTSAFSFKGKNANVSEIGEKLSVKNVLEGSVRRSGNKLRISVQLINAADGYQLWSERYDREMKDIFEVQDEIALAVVDALKLKLFGGEKAAVLKRYTNNPEAYQLYLSGRFFFLKRTPEGFKKAIDYFEKAIECDSEYALAFTGIADSYVLLGFYEVMTPAEAREYAKPAVYKSIELDGTIAETHASLAVYLMFCEWEFVKAEAEFEEAIRLNPNYTLARHFYAVNLVLIGSHDEAIAEESRSVEIEPFTAIFRAAYSWYSYLVRRNDLSIEQALRTIELAPDHFFAYWALGLAYALNEKYDESLSALQRASSLTGGNQHLLGEIARVSALSGKRDEALGILDEFLQQSKASYVSAVNITKIYAGLGEREKVLEWLEKAYDERAVKLPWFIIDPCLDAFRGDERFQTILKKMGLPTTPDVF